MFPSFFPPNGWGVVYLELLKELLKLFLWLMEYLRRLRKRQEFGGLLLPE